MERSGEDRDSLARELSKFGLILRGGFRPVADDRLGDVRTVLLIGNAGPPLWQAFTRGRIEETDPLDGFVRRSLTPVAERLKARLVMPNDGPPYWPFQRWAMRAEPVSPSPLGLLIHPDYGLWHAYRAALLTTDIWPIEAPLSEQSPCESCADRPCLSACPVGAFEVSSGTPAERLAHYDVPSCRDHLETPSGADCLDLGCRARRACPVGRSFQSEPDQAAFHMRSFRRGLGERTAPS